LSLLIVVMSAHVSSHPAATTTATSTTAAVAGLAMLIGRMRERIQSWRLISGGSRVLGVGGIQ
jgi:hypothetical protein